MAAGPVRPVAKKKATSEPMFLGQIGIVASSLRDTPENTADVAVLEGLRITEEGFHVSQCVYTS